MKLWKEETRIAKKKVLVANQLREARLAAKLSQSDLAEAAGITDTMVSYLETGKREASRELARVIFKTLSAKGVKLQWK